MTVRKGDIMTQNDAEFDRALGAWEDNQLNAHLTKEEEWDFAYDEAWDAVWELELTQLHEMAPPTLVREMETVAEKMASHIAHLILEGRWENG